MTRVYKILGAQEWREAEEQGVYHGSTVDRSDGFIHLSTAHQAAETARRHFHGVDHLVLLELRSERLGAALRFEPSRGGARFPHLYRSLRPHEVVSIRPLRLGADGAPQTGDLEP